MLPDGILNIPSGFYFEILRQLRRFALLAGTSLVFPLSEELGETIPAGDMTAGQTHGMAGDLLALDTLSDATSVVDLGRDPVDVLQDLHQLHKGPVLLQVGILQGLPGSSRV